MLYTKAQYEQDIEALDVMDSCLSAANNGSVCNQRIIDRAEDLYGIVMYCGEDKTLKRGLRHLISNVRMDGLTVLSFAARIEWARRKLKGRLMQTREILAENRHKSRCDNPKVHSQPCFCRNLNEFLAEEAMNDAG